MIYCQVCANFRNLGKDGDKMAKEEWTSLRQDENTKLEHWKLTQAKSL